MEHVSNDEVLRKTKKKRTFTQNYKKTVEISQKYNEKRDPGEFDTHGIYQTPQSQGKPSGPSS